MQLSGSHTLNATREQVWAALQDPAVLARCVPGVKNLSPDGPDRFKGAVDFQVGPVKGTYQGVLTIRNATPPASMTLDLEAKAPVGIIRATGVMQLQQQGNGTLLTWTGSPQLSGMLATLGARLLPTVAQQMAGKFFSKLEAEAQRKPGGVTV